MVRKEEQKYPEKDLLIPLSHRQARNEYHTWRHWGLPQSDAVHLSSYQGTGAWQRSGAARPLRDLELEVTLKDWLVGYPHPDTQALLNNHRLDEDTPLTNSSFS